MDINFFWKGNDFTPFDRLCILSHVKVGHEVIIWLSGETPLSKYWIEDNVSIKNADDIFNVDTFIEDGGNFQTASALWRFHFLYNYGGWYCDTDAFAVQHFPDSEWIICSAEEDNTLKSIGVLKTPPKHPLFIDCLSNIEYKWGNVKVFSEAYFDWFGNTPQEYDNSLFYPYTWKKYDTLIKEIDIPYCYSVHLYGTMLKRNNVKYEKKSGTLLTKLIEMVGE